jgi:enoyl-CoA hydratase/carnithine racemase
VLLITLDRPEVRNAVDARMTVELGEAIGLLESTTHLRAGVITGAGDAFCAGLDMKGVAAGADIEATRHPLWGFAGMTSRDVGKPLVAALNGAAVGGGLEIALACDVIIAASSARLGLPEVRHGVFAAGGGVLRLAQQLPRKVAVELLLTGRLMPADEARNWGLVNAIVPEGDLLDEALRVAQRIAENAPLAIRATKRLLAGAGELSPSAPVAIAITDDAAAEVFASLDAIEGIAAFAEGRRPQFTGR